MIDRAAVRNNANYLRNVRPIDPEEIAAYIEGSPHPAVVRETLREEALDLRLRERADGPSRRSRSERPTGRRRRSPKAMRSLSKTCLFESSARTGTAGRRATSCARPCAG